MAYRLLVVPGDSEDLRALQNQLGSDVAVQLLDTANDALWEVRNAPPEVIVANVELPGMSGLDLAEILPNFGVATKVVLWSRSPDQQAAQQAASLGVHRFLNGAVPAHELQSVVYEALREVEGAQSSEPVAAPADPTPPAEPGPPAGSERAPAGPAAPPEGRSSSSLSDRLRRERPASTSERGGRAERPAASSSEQPARPTRRREGALVLTPESLRSIRTRLDGLDRDVGSRCILLADRAGMVLAETGHTAGFPTMVLLPLLSTSFSTAGQITQMLREQESSALYVHEGSHYDLYCFDILQRFMLVIVFDKTASSAKIGSVWVYAKRAIRDIQDLLS
nr:MAG: response regulator [Chloroflexota bacterium]